MTSFIAAVSTALAIPTARIEVHRVSSGSVIVEFDILRSTNRSLYGIRTPSMLYQELEAKVRTAPVWTQSSRLRVLRLSP